MDAKVYDKIMEHVRQLFEDYDADISKAYLSTEKTFTISIKAKLTAEKDSGTKVVTSIDFSPATKIKDSMEGVVGKKQMSLSEAQ
jgi:C-terminal processing protease CtpA/Prc